MRGMKMKNGKLIAVRGSQKLYYTHDEKSQNGFSINRMGYIESDGVRSDVNVDSALSRGYWEDASKTTGERE